MNVMINDISHDLNTDVKGVQTCDHAVPPDHGRADDPVQQADRPLGPQAVLHRRAHPVRNRRAAERGRAGARRADPRQLRVRRRRHRVPDPARLHPHDDGVHLARVARQGVRGDQWHGRHRRRRRTADRRSDHLGHQLARRVHLPGPDRRDDRRAQPAGRSIRCAPDPKRPFDAIGAVLSAVGMFFVVFGILQAGDEQRRCSSCSWRSASPFLAGFFVYIRVSGAQRERGAAVARACSRTARPTSA